MELHLMVEEDQDLKQPIEKKGIFIHQWEIIINLNPVISTTKMYKVTQTVLQEQVKDRIIS